MVGLYHGRLDAAHPAHCGPRYLAEIRGYGDRGLAIRDAQPVGRSVVWNLEEQHPETSNTKRLPRLHDLCPELLSHTRRRVNRQPALPNQPGHACGMVAMTVGKQHRPEIAEAPTQCPEQLYEPAARDAGIYQDTRPRAGLDIGGIT